MRALQAVGEVGGGGAGDEVAVGIMPVWQLDDASCETSILESQGELVRSLLPGLVFILVESNVDRTARLIGKLSQLSWR